MFVTKFMLTLSCFLHRLERLHFHALLDRIKMFSKNYVVAQKIIFLFYKLWQFCEYYQKKI